MSGKESAATRRILAAFGEPDEFFGVTLADLKLLVPTVFAGAIIAGNTPAVMQPAGYAGGTGLVLACILLIYATPEYHTAPTWLRDRLSYLTTPGRFVRDGSDDASRDAPRAHPPVARDETGEDTGPIGAVIATDGPGDSRSLTGLQRFLSRDAGRRADESLFGAVEVEPANMALATDADWEHAVEGFGAAVNGLDFPFQIYSTVTTVDPERITAGYRSRLRRDESGVTADFQNLIAAYATQFPTEFAKRGTGTRRYYVIVPVKPLDVQTRGSGVDQAGLIDRLCDLPYVGGFMLTIVAFRRQESVAERRQRQLAELDRRLDAIEHGLRSISGCSTRRLTTDELAGLLDDYWTGAQPGASDENLTPRTAPIITTEQEDPQ